MNMIPMPLLVLMAGASFGSPIARSTRSIDLDNGSLRAAGERHRRADTSARPRQRLTARNQAQVHYHRPFMRRLPGLASSVSRSTT